MEVYGVNDEKLDVIKKYHPKLKIVARGNELKLSGTNIAISQFENRFSKILNHISKYDNLSMNKLENILNDVAGKKSDDQLVADNDPVILYGINGKIILAKTPNQKKLLKSVAYNDIVFAIGPAGTGKTYTSVALAVKALKNKEVKRIVLTRPAVEAGESLGFLPGDLKEKLDPYLMPLYDALRDMLPFEKLSTYIESKIIEIAPIAFMRGRTLSDAFVILDEAQNTTELQLRMVLSRIGHSSKFIINGDVTQVDLPRNQRSGLIQAQGILENIRGIEFIYLDGQDVIRHHLVKNIIEAYQNNKPNDLNR